MNRKVIRVRVTDNHIDHTNRDGVARDLLRQCNGAGDVVLDFGAVKKIDAAGLKWLLEFRETLQADNRDLELTEVHGPVHEMIMLSRLDRLVPVRLVDAPASEEEE